MAKNRKFKNTYVVEISGTTSNGFQAQLFDETIRAVCSAFGINSQQCAVTVKVISSEGEYDAETRALRNKENGKEN